MLTQPIKCIIWDLDETLWDGTLVENEGLEPRTAITDLIPELDRKGVINSICSKNHFGDASEVLKDLGLWGYFVFPVIEFAPKGQQIEMIIDHLQLRPDNVLFIDDNPGNRNEAQYYCPNLMVADPNEPGFVEVLKGIVQSTEGSSRLERYKLLETKTSAKQAFSDNSQFLHDSDIRVCIIRNPADLTFKQRIIELGNRTNQLNFTTSRFPDDASFEQAFEQQVTKNHGVIFVYDKYGDYGLVGFYAFDEDGSKRHLEHCFFSCRILNMGVEQAVYQFLRQRYHIKPFAALEEKPSDTSYITILEKPDRHLQDYIEHKLSGDENYRTTIIAGCTSGMISHYLPDTLQPTYFENYRLSEAQPLATPADTVIYTIYSHYINKRWPNKRFRYALFRQRLAQMIQANQDKTIYFLLSSEAYPVPLPARLRDKLKCFEAALLRGRSARRYKRCNQMVRDMAQHHAHVHALEMGGFVTSPDEQIDARHFHRIVIQRLCNHIKALQTEQVC